MEKKERNEMMMMMRREKETQKTHNTRARAGAQVRAARDGLF